MNDNKKNIREERIRKVFIVLTTLYSKTRFGWSKVSLGRIIADAGLTSPWPGSVSKVIQNGYAEQMTGCVGKWRWINENIIPDMIISEKVHDAAKLINDNKKANKKNDKVNGLLKINKYNRNIPDREHIKTVLTKMSSSYKKSEIIDQSIFEHNKIHDKEVFLSVLSDLGVITKRKNTNIYYWGVDILKVDKVIVNSIFDEYVKKYIHSKTKDDDMMSNVLNFLYEIDDAKGYAGSIQQLLKKFKLLAAHKAMAVRLNIISDKSSNPVKPLYFVNKEITKKNAKDIIDGVKQLAKVRMTRLRDNIAIILNSLNKMDNDAAIHRETFVDKYQIDDVVFDALVHVGIIKKFPGSNHYNASDINITNKLIKSIMDYDPDDKNRPENLIADKIKKLTQIILEIRFANGLKSGLKSKFVSRDLDMSCMTKLMELGYLTNKGTATKPEYYVSNAAASEMAKDVINSLETLRPDPMRIDDRAKRLLCVLQNIHDFGLTSGLCTHMIKNNLGKDVATTLISMNAIHNEGTTKKINYVLKEPPTMDLVREAFKQTRERLKMLEYNRNVKKGFVKDNDIVKVPINIVEEKPVVFEKTKDIVKTPINIIEEKPKKPNGIGSTNDFNKIYKHSVKMMEYNTLSMLQCEANIKSLNAKIAEIQNQIVEQQRIFNEHKLDYSVSEKTVTTMDNLAVK